MGRYAEFMKKLKLFVSLLLVISMFFSCTLFVSAASASISASAGKTDVGYGDTVTVSVKLTSNPGMAGVNFSLTYNSSHLQYQSSSVGSAGSGFSLASVNPNGASIKGAFINADGSTVSSTGTLATVTFKVITSSNASSYLTVSASGTDGDANTVYVSTSNVTLNLNALTTVKPTTTTKPTTTKITTTTKPTTTKPRMTETVNGESTTKIIATETIGVKKGNAYQLAKPSSMSGSVTYSSSRTSVATVSSSGIVKTLSKGMTTITAVSENGVTKTWLLIVGDGSTVETDETTTSSEEEETTTEIAVIGSVTEEKTTEEKTTGESTASAKKDSDKTFRLIFGTGIAVAILVVIIVIASMIRKKRSFIG